MTDKQAIKKIQTRVLKTREKKNCYRLCIYLYIERTKDRLGKTIDQGIQSLHYLTFLRRFTGWEWMGSNCKAHSIFLFRFHRIFSSWLQNVGLYLCIFYTHNQCGIKILKLRHLISSNIFTTRIATIGSLWEFDKCWLNAHISQKINSFASFLFKIFYFKYLVWLEYILYELIHFYVHIAFVHIHIFLGVI